MHVKHVWQIGNAVLIKIAVEPRLLAHRRRMHPACKKIIEVRLIHIAVQAFLAGRIPFLGLAGVVEETLAAVDGAPAGDLDELVEADSAARGLAERAAGALVT